MIALLTASLFLSQLGLKAALALRVRRREAAPQHWDLSDLTVLQPVVSGDPELEAVLSEDRLVLPGARFLWIPDRCDAEAVALCRRLATTCAALGPCEVLEVEEPPEGMNPKMWKQHLALPQVQTRWVAVIDDDTRVTHAGVQHLIERVEAGAMLATGLPCYVPTPGLWSRLVTEWVNSSAILTYLPGAALAEPISINGMCYLLKTEEVRRHALFTRGLKAITDDLALACLVRELKGGIAQTSRPQFISTTVSGPLHFARLLHRWFVFIRLLLQRQSWGRRCALLGSFIVPALLLWVSLLLFWCEADWPAALGLSLGFLALRSALIAWVNRRLTGSPRHAPLLSLLMEALQGGFLLGAWCYPVIWWRRRRILVQSFDHFDYLRK